MPGRRIVCIRLRIGAAWIGRGIANRIGNRHLRRALRLDLDIARGTKQIRGVEFLASHEALLLGSLDLLEVRNASGCLRRTAVLNEVRDRNSSQNGDDGDHDHDFYEGKTLQHLFHGCVPFVCFVYLCRHHADTKIYMQILCQFKKCDNKHSIPARNAHIRLLIALQSLSHK